METIILNKKEAARRKLILEGNIYKTILLISAPSAFYNLLNRFFGFFNMIMVADLGKETISMVAYINQLEFMIVSFGSGLSVGGGILIAKYFGSGDFVKTKKYTSNLIILTLAMGAITLLICIPFAESILRLAKMPSELIDIGKIYFRIEILSVVCIFINMIFMAVERARGNTKKVMYLNIGVIIIKLILTYIFVKILGYGSTSVAVASLVAQLSLTVVALYILLFDENNVFRVRVSEVKLDKEVIKPIFTLSLPIIVENVAFNFGKVYVNSMGHLYGSTATGALGLSNQLGSLITTVPQGLQTGETTIISQNIGNNNKDRALETFYKTLLISIIYSVISLVVIFSFMDQLIGLYANGDLAFAQEIKTIFSLEMYGTITLNISTVVMGLLYGIGYTKSALVINMVRVFVFRIPVIYYFAYFTNLGIEALGYGMLISNVCVGVISLMYAVYIIRNMKKQNIELKRI